MLVSEVSVFGCLEVAEYPVKCSLVLFSRVCSVSAKCSDGIGKVQLSAEHGVHDGAKGALI